MSTSKWTTAKRIVAWCLVLNLVLPPLPVLADVYVPGKGLFQRTVTPPPANALPQPQNIDPSQAVLEKPGDNKLVVHQKTDKAILEWKSFDIGAGAWTHFDQKGRTDWSALNRIYDKNPSLIFGRLTADGKVFLVNQNGMLFGPNSRVQTHDLVASALDIDDQDFLGDVLKYKSNDYIDNPGQAGPGDATVSNQGTITVDRNGTVTLLGPNVENSGTIDAPAGRVELAAAEEIKFDKREINGTPVSPGTVTNHKGAVISADTGVAELFGSVVNQDGVIRSVAAVDNGGDIRLKATQRVNTGADSVIACPISNSTETVNETFDKNSGTIQVSAPLIEHHGQIVAPSGAVIFTAAAVKDANGNNLQDGRILLHTGSVIDVSGETVDLKAQDRVATMQLNSIQLRDDYGQKDGELKGQTIAFDTRRGSAIGNTADAIKTQPQTAKQKNVAGGTITLAAHEGDIIQKEGASLLFKGGQTNYAAGFVATTKLISGCKVYDISEAPQWLTYDSVLGSYEKRYERFGIVERYDDSPYLGGGSILKGGYSPAYSQGADAGTLTLEGKRVVLDGSLDGSVVVGAYQTQKNEMLDVDENELTKGLSRPDGGKLIVGYGSNRGANTAAERDLILNEVLITADRSSLGSDFGTADALEQLPDVTRQGAFSPETSLISADLLNHSGLGTIEIYANDRIATEVGSRVSLPVGGTFTAAARNIEHSGTLEVPSGTVTLQGISTPSSLLTSDPLADDGFEEGIFLSGESLISVAGARSDYSQITQSEEGVPLYSAQALGGEIRLIDENYAHIQGETTFTPRSGKGVTMAAGARLDVSGGYTVDPDGDLTAGNAGTLELKGASLLLEGELAGYSLVGANGGTLKLHAQNATVRAEESDVSEGAAGLILSVDQLADTGFSKLEITSENDLVVEQGAMLSPSYAKTVAPSPTAAGKVLQGYFNQNAFSSGSVEASGLVYLPLEMVDDASIKLTAGARISKDNIYFTEIDQKITIARGARLTVAPGGDITLDGPVVKVGGELKAHGGDISVAAGELTLQSGALLDVSGTLIPESQGAVQGLPAAFTPLDAGTVTLEASYGNLRLEEGSTIDLSGSRPAEYYQLQADWTIQTGTSAGDPGALTLRYYDALEMEGSIKADAYLASLAGASLTIHRTHESEGLDVNTLGLQRTSSEEGLLDAGFDSLTLQSNHSLIFSDDLALTVGRELTLDAPLITASTDLEVTMKAPWIKVANTYETLTSSTPAGGAARLTLIAADVQDQGYGWLDVTGNLRFSGFDEVSLNSAGDMVFADYYYKASDKVSGSLATAGRLNLRADQIYPGVSADFQISAPERIVVDRYDDSLADNALVYSAGGRLALLSDQIHNYGRILAPSGEIILCKSIETRTGDDGEMITDYTKAGRIYLAQGSSISAKGEYNVNIGALADPEVENSWQLVKGTDTTTITAAPEKHMVISAGEVIQREGAEIDGSGGGGVFAYGWLAGIEGSVDPLSSDTGRMVIVPGASTALPGEAIYIQGGAGLAEGVYTILPEAYAFLPGAKILEERGTSRLTGLAGGTIEGYNVVQGYRTVAGTDVRDGLLTNYAVRPAEEVLAQGHYTIASYSAGDGGTINISGDTTILSGTILGRAQEGFDGGILELSGMNILFQEMPTVLGAEFNAQTVIADDSNLKDNLNVATAGITETGFDRIRIGSVSYDEDNGYTGTHTITISAGSQLTANNLELAAIDAILIQGTGAGDDTLLKANGDQGTLELTSQGQVVLEDGATLGAVSAIVFDAPNLALNGAMDVENSTIALRGDRITFADTAGEGDGLTITPELWEKISGNENVELLSRSDVFFDIRSEDASRWAADDLLRIDAARLVNLAGQSVDVTVSARTIELLNSSGTASDTLAGTGGGALRLSAEAIDVGRGQTTVEGFDTVRLTAASSSGAADSTPSYITFRGNGGLTTAAELVLTADAVRTDLYRWTGADGSESYEAANFRVDAGSRLSLERGASGTELDSEAYAGLPGALNLSAGEIQITGAIVMPAGQLSITAQNDINVGQGAEIYLAGDEYFAGGSLQLTGRGAGNVTIGAGAEINLDAGEQGDAGSLAITVAGGAIALAGTLDAHADGGAGGSFALDAESIGNLDALLGSIQNSGFSRSVSVRSTSGDLTVGGGVQRVQISADRIELAADGGALTIANADLSAAAEGAGGLIELYASGDPDDTATLTSGNVEIGAGAVLTTGTGGRIYAASALGTIDMHSGSRMRAQGGTVHFRALRNGNTPGMTLAGTIDGATTVTAEAVEAISVGDGAIDADEIGQAFSRADAFLDGASSDWQAGLATTAEVRLIAGIEFQGTGDLVINGAAIDLGALSTQYLDGRSGTLTVRSAGNLGLDTPLFDNSVANGWDLHLAAGADLDTADLFATNSDGVGSLSLNNRLFSHTGAVGFASAGDTTIAAPSVDAPTMIANTRLYYSVASYNGSVTGVVGGDLELEGGVVQSATGPIDLAVGGDLNFSEDGGAIRTTGRPAEGVSTQWVWAYEKGGGAIEIQTGGHINGAGLLNIETAIIDPTPWDTYSRDNSFGSTDRSLHYTADYNGANGATQGIAAMAGGDVAVRAGGDIACQVGSFGAAEQGGGDLKVFSGGDITGRYLVRQGQGDLTALGNIGLGQKPTTLELCAVGEVKALAVGSVELDGILNPTLLAESTLSSYTVQNSSRFLSYAQESAVAIAAVEGDISLLGNYGYNMITQTNTGRQAILPPSLELQAGDDILIGSKFKMVPSPDGDLTLIAGGTISGPDIAKSGGIQGSIDMVDWDADGLDVLYELGADIAVLLGREEDRTSLLHSGDDTPVVIAAGENIENIAFTLPKQALICAVNDIVDIKYQGQNMGADDFSVIHAGGDFRLGVDPNLNITQGLLTVHNTGIEQGGAGTLLVQAGGSMDLGASYGIEAVGNKYNLALEEKSALLAVAAGYDLFESFARNTTLGDPASVSADLYADTLGITAGLQVLFDQIRDSGRTYSELLAEGREAEAEEFVARFRNEVLYDLLAKPADDATGEYGYINMINSKIKTVDSSEGIYIITAGDINVGRSTIPKKDQTSRESGIFTEAGGAINIYAAGNRIDDGTGNIEVSGNINVNESRIMTFLGGDITVWADQGDINAGRGSKGAIIQPEEEVDLETGVKKYKPPVQGSGIRALTYDPDGSEGPRQPAKAGDGYIFAPEGEIDAGEAGISVANIFLAATKYANVQNIEVAGLSVGMPVMVDSGAGMDALAGSNNSIAEVMNSGQESISGSAKERMDKALKSINENLVKLLNVEVIGFGTADEDEQDKKDKQ